MTPQRKAGTARSSRAAQCVAAALAAGVLGLAAGGAAAQELSERSMRTFMDYAWALTPQKFTKPNGQTVEIDKKKREPVMVPMETVREVIRVGRLSAHAQLCELADDQVENYRSLMRREELKKTWTEQQLIYINQLHLTTVMLLTGALKLVERDGDKEVVVEEKKVKAQTCTEEQRKKVSQMVAEYVKAGPSPAARADAPAAAPPAATGSTTPPAKATPASSKK